MEDLEDYMSDSQSFLLHDEDDDADEDLYDFTEELPVEVDELGPPLGQAPYNEWCHTVSENIGHLTGFAQSIETVGYETWWWAWWREGKTAEEAAALGLRDEILLEDE